MFRTTLSPIHGPFPISHFGGSPLACKVRNTIKQPRKGTWLHGSNRIFRVHDVHVACRNRSYAPDQGYLKSLLARVPTPL